MLDRIAETGRLLLYVAGLMVSIAALAHALGFVLTRRGTVGWVWRFWNVLRVGLLVAGLAALGYGWLVLGLQTGTGSTLVGLGILLASAGLWMIVPV